MERFELRGLKPLPTEVATICAFLTDQAHELCLSRMRRWLYAVRKIHRLLRLPDPTANDDIAIVLRRARRGRLCRPKQAKGNDA
ncbi:MAG: hypothetical protein RL268_2269 [Pseudomonadota bacterium]